MAMGKLHKKLFAEYVRELTEALKLARQASRPKQPLASDARVLGVMIEFFFRCEKLNADIEEDGGDDEVEPLDFVTDMLSGTQEALHDEILELPYMPWGLDQDDEWV